MATGIKYKTTRPKLAQDQSLADHFKKVKSGYQVICSKALKSTNLAAPVHVKIRATK